MKTNLLIGAALAICATLLLVPHTRRDPGGFKPNTLGGIYWKLLSDLPDRWNAERATFLLILLVGLFAAAAPVVVALMLRWHRPADGAAGGVAYAAVALVTLLGAVANFFLILLSHTSFAFGGSALPRNVTAFAWGVAIFQTLVALATFAVAFAPRFAALAR